MIPQCDECSSRTNSTMLACLSQGASSSSLKVHPAVYLFFFEKTGRTMKCSAIDLHRTAERSFMERSSRCRMQNQPVCRPLGTIGRMES